jgi:aspartate aminotransferase
MAVAKSIAEQLERASWIRRMFEEGARLKKERGEANIFDFTLGNPEVEPPALTLATLRRVVDTGRLHSHGYMPNPGFPEVRAAIADKLRREIGLPFSAEHVCMTSGAAAACNVILKSILDPGDEVILLAPFFAEYPFYVGNHGGRVVVVETDDDCLPEVGRIAAAIPRAPAPSSSTHPTILPAGSIRLLCCANWKACWRACPTRPWSSATSPTRAWCMTAARLPR